MRLVDLGSTGIQVSQIGLGTVKLGRNQGVKYPQDFSLPSDAEVHQLLEGARELGINLLDTAPAYGSSEERLGSALQGQRDKWILSTKVGEEFIDGNSSFDFSPEFIHKSVERSLKRLRTDYLDVVLVHSNGADKELIQQQNVFAELIKMKEKGLLRAFGMSTKTVEGGLLAVEQSDVVMVTYNLLNTEDLPIIRLAQEKKKGIFIKKAFASGHLDKISEQDPVRKSLEFIFQEAGVTSAILGTLNLEHLKLNAAICKNIVMPAFAGMTSNT